MGGVCRGSHPGHLGLFKGKRIKTAFLWVFLTRVAHSIEEEYLERLWQVFPSARYLTSLISSDLKAGFLIINMGFFKGGPLLVLFYAEGISLFNRIDLRLDLI